MGLPGPWSTLVQEPNSTKFTYSSTNPHLHYTFVSLLLPVFANWKLFKNSCTVILAVFEKRDTVLGSEDRVVNKAEMFPILLSLCSSEDC